MNQYEPAFALATVREVGKWMVRMGGEKLNEY